MSGKGFRVVFFFEIKIILLQTFLWSHGLQFWQFCQICFGSNLKESRSEPKSFKNSASFKTLSFGNFRRIPRMHSWQNWSFRKGFSTSSSGHVVFSFDSLVEKFCQHLEFVHSKSTNRIKILFFFSKENFLSQSVFLDTWNAFLTNLLKVFRQETGNFALLPRKAKKLVCDKFFCSKCFSVHVECLPSSFKLYSN